jgi:hypothetical protein
LISRQSVFGYLATATRIVDAEHRPVANVKVGQQFLHCVDIGENLSPNSIEIVVSNCLMSTSQLWFIRADGACAPSWSFSFELGPMDRGEEQSILAECHAKTSGDSSIKTNVAFTADQEVCEAIRLKVEIL